MPGAAALAGHDRFAAAYLDNLRRTFRGYRQLAERALDQVPDAAIHARPDTESNSLAVLVAHLAGNLRSRLSEFLTTDGEKPERQRDAEFEVGPSETRAALLARWHQAWDIALETLDGLEPADLGRTVSIQQEPYPVIDALNRTLTHTAYHVGQLVYLAKHFTGPDWVSLSVPRRRPS